MSKFWFVKFIRDCWNVRTPEKYATYVRACAVEPQAAYFLQNSAKAGAYPEGDNGWRYKSERLPVHDKLLKKYKLDDIAGQGSAFERALRLMGWLTAHTWYSGMSFWSILWFGRNIYQGGWADSLRVLRYAYGGPFARSLNCGYQAIVLADCLLAAGVHAMPVSIQSFSYRPGEEKVIPCPNHTVVHAWLPEERRWVMLDPSFNSYISDNTGRALNLIEIQRRHRQGESLSVAQYNLNGTRDCMREYLDGFILGSLLEIQAWDGADRKGGLRNRLLPEDVPRKEEEARAITSAELLAEPIAEEAANL